MLNHVTTMQKLHTVQSVSLSQGEMCFSPCSFIQVLKSPQELLQQRVAQRARQGQLTGFRRGQPQQWHSGQQLPHGRRPARCPEAVPHRLDRVFRRSHQREWHSERRRGGLPPASGTGQPHQRHRDSVRETEDLRGPRRPSSWVSAQHGRPAGRGAAQTGPGALLRH